MEIILAKTCEAISGSLNKKHGYYIRQQKQKNGRSRFFGHRSSRGAVPPEGHWRFIADCAEVASCGLLIADILVPGKELEEALTEAHHWTAAQHLRLDTYHARDILNLKKTFGL